MKILVVSQYFYPEDFKINDAVDFLVSSGHEVRVLTAFPNYPSGSFFDGYGFFGSYPDITEVLEFIEHLLSLGRKIHSI